MVANAKTPADHEAIAEYFDREAAAKGRVEISSQAGADLYAISQLLQGQNGAALR
jgi:hypothetical protein